MLAILAIELKTESIKPILTASRQYGSLHRNIDQNGEWGSCSAVIYPRRNEMVRPAGTSEPAINSRLPSSLTRAVSWNSRIMAPARV